MGELPRLPQRAERKLALQWGALIDKHGFTGEHLGWPRTRRRKLVSSACPPPTMLGQGPFYLGQGSKERLVGPIYEPEERVGIIETLRIAQERFVQLASEYFALWSARQGADFESFAAWLQQIRAMVAIEAGQLWVGRGNWFERECGPKVIDGLSALVMQWAARARDWELKRLESEPSATAEPASVACAASSKSQAEPGASPEALPEQRAPACVESGDATATGAETSLAQRRAKKGDPTLIEGKRVVSFQTAEAYLGISARQRQVLTKQGSLVVEGKGLNRRITTESLRNYLPPENPK